MTHFASQTDFQKLRMNLRLFFVVCASFICFSGIAIETAAAQEVWNATDWTEHETIVIDADLIDETLTDFPVYVDLTDMPSGFWSTTPSGASLVGTDIRITNNSDVELARELVFASSTAETGELHFKADSISASADTTFKIWYNGTTTGDYAATSTYGAHNVWTNNFIAVYHLEEDGSVTNYVDATGNGNTGTAVSIDAADQVTGKLGAGVNTDGTPEGITISDSTDFDWTTGAISGWLQTDTLTTDGTLGARGAGGTSEMLLWFDEGVDDITCAASINSTFYNGSSGGTYTTRSTSEWIHGYCSWDGTDLVGYSNGVSNFTDSTPSGNLDNDAVDGGIAREAAGSRYLDGRVDEVRFHSVGRSAAWVKAEYENQASTTNFYTVNGTSSAPSPDPLAFDAASSGGGDMVTGNFSWTHTPSGTPRGVLVYVAQAGASTDQITGVSYGATSLNRVGRACDTTGSVQGCVYAYAATSSIPTGAQTVSVTVSGSAEKSASAFTYTAGGDTEIIAVDDTSIVDDASDPSATLGLNGREAHVSLGLYYDFPFDSGATPLSGWTNQVEFDFGSQVSGHYTYDTIGSADVTFGYDNITTRDTAVVAVAIGEQLPPPGPGLSGTLFESDGATAISNTATVTVAFATGTPTILSTTTDAFGRFNIALATTSETVPITVFVDGADGIQATTLTFLNGSNTVTGVDLWRDTVRLAHSSTTGDIDLTSATFYNANDDNDILFAVDSSTTTVGSSTTPANLYIASNTTLTPTTELVLFGDLSQQGGFRAESSTTTFRGTDPVATGTLSGVDGFSRVIVDVLSQGEEWRALATAGDDDPWHSVTYGDGLYVAVANAASFLVENSVMTSPDGVTWSTTTAAGDNDNWYSVTYAEGLFVAVGDGSGDHVMTSPDGVTWTARSAAGNNDNWQSVTHGNGLFVAVADEGSTSRDNVMTSPDGITWTVRSAAGNNDYWQSVTYGNGLFVAVGDTAGDRVMTSPDGITWTARSAAGNDDNWQSVTYGNGLFVAVGDDTLPSRDNVMTSPDGVTWTARSAAGDDDGWESVTYDNGIFVAVGDQGDRVMTSPDGITWTVRSAAGNDDGWLEVVSGDGVFVSVGYSGDRVMVSDVGILSVDTASTTHLTIATTSQVESTGTLDITESFRNSGALESFGALRLFGAATTTGSVLSTGNTDFSSSSSLYVDESGNVDLATTTIYGDTSFTGQASTSQLIVNGGGSLTVDGTLEIRGDFTQNGSIDFAATHLILSENAIQTLSGGFTGSNALGDLTLAKTPSWVARSAAGDNDNWQDVAYGDGLFVAVSTSDDPVMTSPDGITWTARSAAGDDDSWRDVTYGDGTFVAVGASGDRVMYSSDGISWSTTTAAGDDDSWQGVAYGTSTFVAVADGVGDTLMYSSDGISWSTSTNPSLNTSWRAVTYGNGTFVVLPYNDFTYYEALYSTDGINWATTTAADIYWDDVTYGNGTFVAVNESAGDGFTAVMTSPDGVTWTGRSAAGDDDYWGAVTYGDEEFVAVGSTFLSEGVVMTSPDGITWTQVPAAENSGIGTGVVFGNEKYVAVGGSGTNRVMTQDSAGSAVRVNSNTDVNTISVGEKSILELDAGTVLSVSGDFTNDGILTASTSEVTFAGTAVQTATGTLSGTSAFYDLTVSNTSQAGETTQSVIWGVPLEVTNTYTMLPGTSAAFVAGATSTLQNIDLQGTEGNEIYLRSLLTGSATWTGRSAAGNNDNWTSVTYGDGLFVAVDDNSGDRVMTSPDGITWTARSAAGDDDGWRSVTYGDGTFVAVGNSGDRVMYSSDGINWATTTAAGDNDDWISVTYGNGLFVAVGQFAIDRVMTSPDGINWTARSAAGDDDPWTSVTYGDGLFVAVAFGGDRVMTSPDGINWTARSAAGDDDAWLDVTYGNGLFVAVGNFTGDRVMYSSDGINWATTTAAGDDDDWQSVTYGNGLFIAVSNSADRVMTSPDGITWTVRSVGGNIAAALWSSITYGDGRFVVVASGGCCRPVMTYSESWGLEVPGSQIGVEFVDVRDSHASTTITATSSIDSGNNVNWTFIEAGGVSGSSTIADHDAGQVDDAFNFMNRTNEPLFAFNLTPESGNATVTELTLSLTGVEDVDPADFSNIRLLRDLDNDAEYDGTDEAVGGAGVLTINTETEDGTIVFSNDFLATTSQNYLVVADWNYPERGAIMNIHLRQSGVVTEDSNGPQDIFGTVSDVQHARLANRGGGGSSSNDIGGAPPAGDGIVEGGTEDGGEQIGNDPNFKRPTVHAGSWINGANAYDGVDGTDAIADSSATSSDWRDHAYAINTGNTIQGVEVKLELNSSPAGETVDVQLSWDGGASWTAAKTSPALTSSDTVISLGGPSDLWGRSWSVTEFSDANFRVRLTAAVTDDNTVRLDEIQVRVYNQAGGGGSGGGADI